MFGCFAAIGSAARALSEDSLSALWPLDSDRRILTVSPDIILARFVPKGYAGDPGFVWSSDRKVVVCLDGYLLSGTAGAKPGLSGQLQAFADEVARGGTLAALGSLEGGSCTILVADQIRNEFYAVGDSFGSLTTFHSPISDGWLVSTNPLALAASGLVDMRPDHTALAQWALFGYAFGNRYAVQGIKLLQLGELIRWDGNARTGAVENEPSIAWSIPQHERTPAPDEIADTFLAACQRLSRIDDRPAHLQSAGLDSRLILAAWPTGYNPPCYTYGEPHAHEITVARSIADARGSNWIHTWQHGDELAGKIEAMFQSGGMIMWPDRYFAAAQMAQDGHRGVLDGLAGDACLGGSLYGFNHYFPKSGRWGMLFARLIDEKMSRVGGDRMAEVAYDAVLQVRNLDSLRDCISDDFIATIRAERPRILDDIRAVINRVTPPDSDSAALVWRNVVLDNRGPHMTILQSVMCRNFVNVYTPFVNDRAFVNLLLGLKPEKIAYHRLYLQVYRRRFPKFADLIWGSSLLPVRRSPLNHKFSKMVMARGRSIPWLTGSTAGKQRDPNGWAVWLRESRALREYARHCLAQGGIINPVNADNMFADLAAGRKEGGGKLFHLASVARWLALARS